METRPCKDWNNGQITVLLSAIEVAKQQYNNTNILGLPINDQERLLSTKNDGNTHPIVKSIACGSCNLCKPNIETTRDTNVSGRVPTTHYISHRRANPNQLNEVKEVNHRTRNYKVTSNYSNS